MDSFGDIIRKLREKNELPLRTVAAYLDIDQAILSKMERGQRKPSRLHVVKLAKYFKVKEDELLVAWLSDKLVYEIGDEQIAVKALQVAEEKLAYLTYKKTDRKSVVTILNKYFKNSGIISKAWIFGSFARGDDDNKSDIDIMIEVPNDIHFSLFDLAEIQFQLEKLIPRKIDIVMKDAVKLAVMEKMKQDMKMIYEK